MTAARHTIYLATVKLGEGRDRVAGAPRTGLAAVSADGVGRPLPWRPRLGYWGIDELAAGAGRVFVGGSLLFPGSENAAKNAAKHGKVIPFTSVAAFSDRGTGVRLPFSPKLGFEFDVGALTVWHRTLIVGGQNVIAYSVDGDARRELWRRSTDSFVFAFARRGPTLYAGGNFDRVARRPRQNLAAFALNRRGASLPFAPKVPIGVEALASLGLGRRLRRSGRRDIPQGASSARRGHCGREARAVACRRTVGQHRRGAHRSGRRRIARSRNLQVARSRGKPGARRHRLAALKGPATSKSRSAVA